MNPWHIIQKVDNTAGWPTLRKHHDTILLAQAELKNWRAMKNHRQQSDPENQESGPKANQGGKQEVQFGHRHSVLRTPEQGGTFSVTLKNSRIIVLVTTVQVLTMNCYVTLAASWIKILIENSRPFLIQKTLLPTSTNQTSLSLFFPISVTLIHYRYLCKP